MDKNGLVSAIMSFQATDVSVYMVVAKNVHHGSRTFVELEIVCGIRRQKNKSGWRDQDLEFWSLKVTELGVWVITSVRWWRDYGGG